MSGVCLYTIKKLPIAIINESPVIIITSLSQPQGAKESDLMYILAKFTGKLGCQIIEFVDLNTRK